MYKHICGKFKDLVFFNILNSPECLVEHRSPLHTERTVNNYTCEEGITLMVNGTKYTNGSFNQGTASSPQYPVIFRCSSVWYKLGETLFIHRVCFKVATLLFASGEEAIHHLFSRDTHREFTYGYGHGFIHVFSDNVVLTKLNFSKHEGNLHTKDLCSKRGVFFTLSRCRVSNLPLRRALQSTLPNT